MKTHHFSPRRQNYRKPGQDYSLPGCYFITINTQNWLRLFGKKSGDKIEINEIGQMIKTVWLEIPNRFPFISLDEFIIMPNHFHAIVQIKQPSLNDSEIDPRDRSLAKIIGAFKSITTVNYIKGVKEKGWPRFQKKLWHFRFYDRIIEDHEAKEKTRNYIINNPKNWNP
jgi:REP element-mobilizing transposase RayT